MSQWQRKNRSLTFSSGANEAALTGRAGQADQLLLHLLQRRRQRPRPARTIFQRSRSHKVTRTSNGAGYFGRKSIGRPTFGLLLCCLQPWVCQPNVFRPNDIVINKKWPNAFLPNAMVISCINQNKVLPNVSQPNDMDFKCINQTLWLAKCLSTKHSVRQTLWSAPASTKHCVSKMSLGKMMLYQKYKPFSVK